MTTQALKPYYDTKAHAWRIRRKEGGKWKQFGDANYTFRDFIETMTEINKLNNNGR
jgi:hypothetical protein